MLILKLAFRNLLRNTRRTALTCLYSRALVIMILMDGMMVGVSRLMVDSLTDTLEGEAQIYHQGFRNVSTLPCIWTIQLLREVLHWIKMSVLLVNGL